MSCMIIFSGEGPRLDHVAVKIFRAVQSHADVRDHGQLFAARQGQNLRELAADVIHRIHFDVTSRGRSAVDAGCSRRRRQSCRGPRAAARTPPSARAERSLAAFLIKVGVVGATRAEAAPANAR